VVKAIWHKAASPLQTDGWIVFARHHCESTLAPPGKYNWICAFFCPPESTIQAASRLVQPFLHSSRQKVSILYNGRSFPPPLPLPIAGSAPPSKTWLPRPIRAHSPNNISIGSGVFAQMTAECPYTLQWDAHSPLKIAPSQGVSGPHLIHCSLGLPESSNLRHAF